MEINKIADKASKYYNIKSYNIINIHKSSRGGDDLRYTYILQDNSDGYKIALKITKNIFTTSERIDGWAALAEHYNNLGIYAPRFLKNTKNKFSSSIEGFAVYAEEYYEGKTGDEADIKDKSLRTDVLKSLGIVAANPAPIVPWYTAWCLYDTFDESDEVDENFRCAINFADYIAENLPAYSEQANNILNKYKTMRSEFEAEYRSLPKSVFQGDLNGSNILLTDDGKFKGVCDFNLSGTETILNILFCECCECWSGAEEEKIARITAASTQYEFDNKAAEDLAVVGEYYKFSDKEKYAFTKYYNITYPFRWINYGFYMYHLRESGEKYAFDIFEWIERQMSRSDIGQILA